MSSNSWQKMAKRRHYAADRRRQSGLTIIELMISLVLGLIIISAVVNVYVGSSRSSRFTEGLRAMQENGRYGVSALQRGIRLAGYSPGIQIDPFDFTVADQDSIVVRSQLPTDCNGQSTAASGGIAVNTYRLDLTEWRIVCRGNSAAATDMPLVEGVYGFRVLYGIDDDGDAFSETYVPYDASLDPLQVNSVRFALLVGSDGPIRTRSVEETHVLLDQEYATNDRLSRRVFTTTVLLRNRR